MSDTKKEVAKKLLEIKAVFLRPSEPFRWASGILSPIYCDNRIILAYPEVRGFVERALADVVSTQYPPAEVLMGTSTAGIPHAAIISELLQLPMGYVRSSAKDHGRNNKIEGAAPDGKRVVVIEDLISTGGSSIEVVEALREAGADVLGIVSIFTYKLQKGTDRLAAANVQNVSLCDIDVLTEVAAEQGYITAEQAELVKKFRTSPDDWLN